jgi:Uma2 family endonuclease
MAAALIPGITPIWPLTVEQYHAMIASGILHSGDPVELLEGVIVEKMPKNPLHCNVTWKTREKLGALVPEGWFVNSQDPITLDKSVPDPDVAVLRGNIDDYLKGHPGVGDIGLVVEVADTSVDRDRILKKRIYAAAGIPIYWVMDLNKRRLEVYAEPRNGAYVQCTVYEPHQQVEVVLDGASVGSILLSGLLP